MPAVNSRAERLKMLESLDFNFTISARSSKTHFLFPLSQCLYESCATVRIDEGIEAYWRGQGLKQEGGRNARSSSYWKVMERHFVNKETVSKEASVVV